MEVTKETTVESDHYPILIEVQPTFEKYETEGIKRWSFCTANWDKFSCLTDHKMQKLDMNVDVK